MFRLLVVLRTVCVAGLAVMMLAGLVAYNTAFAMAPQPEQPFDCYRDCQCHKPGDPLPCEAKAGGTPIQCANTSLCACLPGPTPPGGNICQDNIPP